jgi:hypothetical protein
VTFCLKGTVSRDFLLQDFFDSSPPQAPEYIIRVSSNFFKNSLTYSQVRCTTGTNDTGSKFVNRVNDTGGKFSTGYNVHNSRTPATTEKDANNVYM